MIKDNANIAVLIADSRLAFMQGRYDESLRLAKQALDMVKTTFDFASI